VAVFVTVLTAVLAPVPARADPVPAGVTLRLSPVALAYHTGNRHITGTLLDGNGAAVPGAPVELTLTPAFQQPVTYVIQTEADGSFSYAYHMTRTTRAWARYLDDQGNIVTSQTRTYAVPVATTCTTSPRRTRTLGTIKVACLLPAVPIGTPVHVDYYYRGTWYAVASGVTTHDHLDARLSFGRPGDYPLRVVVHASLTYARSLLRTPSVTVF
jgi:hypothetical protein